MLPKIKKIIRNFLRSLRPSYFLVLLRRSQVKRIEKDGKVFYKYRGFPYPGYLKKGNAVSFILDKTKQYCRGRGIDVGADRWSLPGAIPVQNEKHQNAYKLDNFPDSSLDYVFSSHCLEHLDRWQYALRLWIEKLRINGILFLYLPHESMPLWHPGGAWVNDAHKWIPTYEIVNNFLIDNGVEVIEYNPQKDKYWSFHIVAKKIR